MQTKIPEIVLATLLGGSPTENTPNLPESSLEAIAKVYYGGPLTDAALTELCEYNKKDPNTRGVTGDCSHLEEGAKVVFLPPRVFTYRLCDQNENPTICRMSHQFLSEEEKSTPGYQSATSDQKGCIIEFRWYMPTADFNRVLGAAAMTLDSKPSTVPAQDFCTKAAEVISNPNNNISRETDYNSADLTTEGWIVNNSLGRGSGE